MATSPRTFDSLVMGGTTTPMSSAPSLTPRQLDELNIAAKRMTPVDQKNVEYAKKTYGYQAPMDAAHGQPQPQQEERADFASIGLASSDPMARFSGAVAQMLKEAQGASAGADLFKRQTALRRAMIDKESSMTPEDMRFLSPEQQNSIRRGEVNAIEPELDAVNAEIKAKDVRLQNFEKLVGTIRELGEGVAKVSPSKEVIEGYKRLVLSGESLSTVPAEIRDKVVSMMSDEDLTRAEDMRTRTTSSSSNSSGPISGGTEVVQPSITELNKFLTSYETEFKQFVKDIYSKVSYKLTPGAIADLHQQWLLNKAGASASNSLPPGFKDTMKAGVASKIGTGAKSIFNQEQSTAPNMSMAPSSQSSAAATKAYLRSRANSFQGAINASANPQQAYLRTMNMQDLEEGVKALLTPPK